MESLNHYTWLKGLKAVKTLAESVLWVPETNEIRCALGVPVSLIKGPNFDSWVSLVSIKSVPIFYQKCSSIGSKVSQISIKSVPVLDQKCPREGSCVSQWRFTSYRFLPRHFCFCAAFVGRNKFCSNTTSADALYSRPE